MHSKDNNKNSKSEINEEIIDFQLDDNASKVKLPDENISDSGKSEDEPKAGVDIWQSRLFQSLVVVLLICVIALGLLIYNRTQSDGETASHAFTFSKTIRINEYMISNEYTLRDEDFDSPDWIEIYNYGSKPVSLGDVYLSDDSKAPEKFKLPDITLEPDNYILVLASGKEYTDSEFIHAPFKLSESDNELILFYKNSILNKISLEQLPTDISKGYAVKDELGYFTNPTPGYKNSDEVYYDLNLEAVNTATGKLLINEYTAINKYGIATPEGQRFDWIEIYNPNDYEVFLGDFYLSDDEYSLNKYKLPDKNIAPYGYIVIFASGNTNDTNNIYTAPFGISESDKQIILSYKSGQYVDSIEVYNMNADISAGLDSAGNVKFFSAPTPGYENTSQAFDNIDILPVYPADSPLVINEWMSNNKFGILDGDGDSSDWVEIYNPSDETISLADYAMTDDITEPKKWLFPDNISIEPKSYILVFLSGKDKLSGNEMHANFMLGSEDTLYLIEPNAGIIDSVQMEDLPGNVSKGRTENGYGYFSYPTPNKENTSSYVTEISNGTVFLTNDVYISEVSPGKISERRMWGEYTYEYIELHNKSDAIINLDGYSLVEEDGEPFIFEDITIKPDEYLVVSLKGYIKRELGYISGENISLQSSGERIYLKDNLGVTIDCFDTGYVINNYSSGRQIDNTGVRVFFTEKTPGEANGKAYASYSCKPTFSKQGGMQQSEFDLAITADTDSVIYYTLDGSEPTAESNSSYIYTNPIRISTDITVRASSVTPGKLPSQIQTSTYIFEKTHDIPIICIAVNPEDFFSTARGIYADGYGHNIGQSPYWQSNYYWDVERLISFEYYNTDGTIGVAFDGAISIAGAYSRVHPQKSLAIRLRDEYGVSEIDFPFFEDGHTTFNHLLLRNSGQDHFMTKMRDAFILSCAEDLGTIDTKRSSPAAVYINGEYWGYYNLRDKLNADHMRNKYGYSDDVVIDFLTFAGSPKSGNNEDWFDLKAFCQSHDFNDQENYDALCERIDIDAFMDYWIVQMYFSKRDTHNIDYWKPEIEGGKWRPILFDMDVALLPNDVNVVAELFGNDKLSGDHIKRALITSDIFKEQFLSRCSYVLNNIYTEEYLYSRFHDYKDSMANEMVYHIDRWPSPSSYERWEHHCGVLESELVARRQNVIAEIKEFFKLTDDETLELFPWYEK